MQYCIYLRKSRADAEAEARGEGETLARHERALLELAKRGNYNITRIYREIVSGETITARPVMQQLLHEVEQGVWDGVLVMEIERLARGDTVDQGIVAQTFKYSGTKIITPVKIYNPNNEFDEEYFEFGLFMSRREYKTINRRLQRGRIASVKEGKYAANKAPYGYRRIPLEQGFTLEIVEDEAEVIRLIFDLYTMGERRADGSLERIGTTLIAHRLNALHFPTRGGGDWSVGTIRDILINPVYIGKICWGRRRTVKKMIDGQMRLSTPRSNDFIIADGLHHAIISEETFHLAQEQMAKNPPRPTGERHTVKNPLAGIAICGKCGRHMVRRPYSGGSSPDTLMCPSPACSNVSSHLYIVEERIITALAQWLDGYELTLDPSRAAPYTEYSRHTELKNKALENLRRELEETKKQLNKTYDLLERGIYDDETFILRSDTLAKQITKAENEIGVLESDIDANAALEAGALDIAPKTENLIDVYKQLPTAAAKNDMLHEILEKAVYEKDRRGRRGAADNFRIKLYPKIPPKNVINTNL